MNITRINLNLLVALNALLTERHVTRAGERIGITQSAMSNALNQLRDLFQDELLVRRPKSMVPTARALELAPQLRQVLEQVQSLVNNQQGFDVSTAERVFTVGMSDYAEFVLLPKLCQKLREMAPGVTLKVRHINQLGDSIPFETGEIELGVGLMGEKSAQLRSDVLFSAQAMCIARANHPLMKKPLTVESYLQAEHLRIVYQNDPLPTGTDLALKKLGLERKSPMSIPHLLPALFTLRETDLMVTFPEPITAELAKKLGLAMQKTPFAVPNTEVVQAWHRQLDNDQGHAWLRSIIREVAGPILTLDFLIEK
jgi:DNA-binding transcriptional LysR family regulator